jgi:hypothetical protein
MSLVANHNNTLIQEGLVFYVDAGNTKSVPDPDNIIHDKSPWYDLSQTNTYASLAYLAKAFSFRNLLKNSFFTFQNTYLPISNFTINPYAYTKCAWVRFTNFSGSYFNNIISGSNECQHKFWADELGKLHGGHSSYDVSSSQFLSLNTWYFVCVTYVGYTIKLYINGVMDGIFGGAFDPIYVPNGLSSTQLGGYNDSDFLAGNMSIAMIYDRALNDSEITSLYNHLSWRYESLYTIGQEFKGGQIGYIDPSGRHGLIVGNVDLTYYITWDNCIDGFNYYGATGASIGTGRANTLAITSGNIVYSACNESVANPLYGSVADVCKQYTEGGYNDWFLPSVDELSAIIANNGGLTYPLNSIDDRYWTSTERGIGFPDEVYLVSLIDGPGTYYKSFGPNALRPVRYF